VRRGDPENSELFRRVTLMSSHEDVMPPEGEPLTKAEVKVIEDWIRAGAPTDVQQGDRPKKIRPRQWFQVYNQLDLTEQQRATSTELSMTFQRTMRQFDRDHKTQLEGYKQIVDGKTNATEAEIEEARRAMQQVNKGRPKVEPVQAELWSLLDSTQQDEFRALLVTLAQEGRRDMPTRGQEGRPGRRGDRDGAQLTPEERRRLRERRERRQNQGTEPDRDGD
jgi:hypothetical protein